MLSIVNEVDPLIFHCVCFVCNTNLSFSNSRNTPAYAILIKKEKKRKAIYISIPRNTKEIIPRNKEGVENQPSLRSETQRH